MLAQCECRDDETADHEKDVHTRYGQYVGESVREIDGRMIPVAEVHEVTGDDQQNADTTPAVENPYAGRISGAVTLIETRDAKRTRCRGKRKHSRWGRCAHRKNSGRVPSANAHERQATTTLD